MSKNDRVPDLSDVHGYKVLLRRLTWFALYLFIAAAIALGVVLSTLKAAH